MRKKIIVRGPVLSQSGYGEQTRFAINALRAHEDKFDIFIVPVGWGQTGWICENNEERKWLDFIINKTNHALQNKVAFDVSLQVTIPNEWEKLAPINVGYTAGIETSMVSPAWLEKGNEMDKILVVSNHAKTTYEKTTATAKNIGKIKGVKKIWSKIKKPLSTALWVGTGVEIGKGLEKRKQKTTGIEDKMKTTTPPSTPKNGGSKISGKKTYKQAYSDPKVTAKYKDKGGYKQFVKESEAWWKTSAGQKYAKKHKKFAHRIKK